MQELDPFVILASLLSIFIVYLINRWLGGYTPVRLGGESDTLDRLRQDFPAFNEKAMLVSTDGKSAVVEGVGGGIVLLEAIGDRFLTRMLRPGDIKSLLLDPGGSENGPRLCLRLNDFTNAGFNIRLATGSSGTIWHKRLSQFHDVPQGLAETEQEGDEHE